MEAIVETKVVKSKRKSIKQDESYTLDDLIRDECESDPEFKKIWDEKEPFREAGMVVYNARNSIGMTQRELTQKTGIAQGDICRIESGRANPSIKTLQRLAEGLGMKVQITFVPVEG